MYRECYIPRCTVCLHHVSERIVEVIVAGEVGQGSLQEDGDGRLIWSLEQLDMDYSGWGKCMSLVDRDTQ